MAQSDPAQWSIPPTSRAESPACGDCPYKLSRSSCDDAPQAAGRRCPSKTERVPHRNDAKAPNARPSMPAMLSRARTPFVGRLAAALVAFAMTGALQPVLAHAEAARAHTCRCASHAPGVDCTCPRCHGARSPKVAREPPCHRASPRLAVGDERRDENGSSCLSATCGFPELPQAPTRPGGESFTIPELPPLVGPWWDEVLREKVARPLRRVAAPEPPPPRPA